MIDGYSPVKVSLSGAFVAFISTIESPPLVGGGPRCGQDEDDDAGIEDFRDDKSIVTTI
jgi:hypothetical protein